MSLGKYRSASVTLTAFVLLSVVLGGSASAASLGTGANAASARYIVTLRGAAPVARQLPRNGAASTAAIAAAVARENARVSRIDRDVTGLERRLGFRATARYHWAPQGFAAKLTGAQAAALRADPSVSSVARVRPVFLAEVPTGVARVNADPATVPPPVNLSSVNVAVIDTGIRYVHTSPAPALHEDPKLNVMGGVDCSGDGTNGSTAPDHWKDVDRHGTHVAGTIGAMDPLKMPTNVIGVAPGVPLWAVRVFRTNGGGGLVGDSSTVACGINWVAQTRSATPPTVGGNPVPPIDVANMSIQGGLPNGDAASCALASEPDPEHQAICAARTAGVTVVVAAGNSGANASHTVPAAYDEVITVAALADTDGQAGGLGSGCTGDRDDTFASYSNYGPAVDLIAPGSCIRSLSVAGDNTTLMSGTSMAAPHVTGAAARYLAGFSVGSRPNVDGVRIALRAAASFDWDSTTDPADIADRLLDVGALTAAPSVGVAAFPASTKLRAPAVASDPSLADVDVEIRRIGLDPGDVTLTTSALPTGVSASFEPPTLNGLGAVSSVMHVSAGPTAADADVPVTVHATFGSETEDAVVTLRIDRHRPVVGAFTAQLVQNTGLSSAQPVRLTWTGQDAGSGITRYEMRRRIGTGGWHTVSASPAPTATIVKLVAPKTDYAFQVRAVDAVGNVGDWT
ncbi:MAG: hypothetical protein QOH61_1231, partial [Chloroflexota bacterium]|nr:hypothetical protein [Chloroflexota bacterium]